MSYRYEPTYRNTPNVPLINDLIAALGQTTAKPSIDPEGFDKMAFDMTDWVTDVEDDEGDFCGTACCIAGAAIVLDGVATGMTFGSALKRARNGTFENSYTEEGERLLGVEGVSSLFHSGEWPWWLQDQVLAHQKTEAEAAIELLTALRDGGYGGYQALYA